MGFDHSGAPWGKLLLRRGTDPSRPRPVPAGRPPASPAHNSGGALKYGLWSRCLGNLELPTEEFSSMKRVKMLNLLCFPTKSMAFSALSTRIAAYSVWSESQTSGFETSLTLLLGLRVYWTAQIWDTRRRCLNQRMPQTYPPFLSFWWPKTHMQDGIGFHQVRGFPPKKLTEFRRYTWGLALPCK